MRIRSRAATATLALTALLPVAAVTGLGADHAGAAIAETKVKVSNVTAGWQPTRGGTRVGVSFQLENTASGRTQPRRAKFFLVSADGGTQRLLGSASVPALAPGETRTFFRNQVVGPRIVEGDYRTRVCYTRLPGADCSISKRADVTILPSDLTSPTPGVVVPETSSVRIRVVNTGQARSGPLQTSVRSFGFVPVRRGGEIRSLRRAPSLDYEVDATTCGASLAAGQSCTVDVSRTAEGNPGGTAELVVRGLRGSVLEVALTPPLRVVPLRHEFGGETGQVAVGDADAFTYRVVNDGETEAQVFTGFLQNERDFTFTGFGTRRFTCAGDGPVTVEPGSSCTFTVEFVPQTEGFKRSEGVILTTEAVLPFLGKGQGTPGEGVPGEPGVPGPVGPGQRTATFGSLPAAG
ncbi:hypothetical protein GCM10023340_13110 [Nocardioides marinquilinus]|uniref:Choice-of-anchor D domain-containing protein n=1 Tax=Nocardioides marinquilinus TaxID=1210400 RepID=A0ABP9PDH5_9ACTN